MRTVTFHAHRNEDFFRAIVERAEILVEHRFLKSASLLISRGSGEFTDLPDTVIGACVVTATTVKGRPLLNDTRKYQEVTWTLRPPNVSSFIVEEPSSVIYREISLYGYPSGLDTRGTFAYGHLDLHQTPDSLEYLVRFELDLALRPYKQGVIPAYDPDGQAEKIVGPHKPIRR